MHSETCLSLVYLSSFVFLGIACANNSCGVILTIIHIHINRVVHTRYIQALDGQNNNKIYYTQLLA